MILRLPKIKLGSKIAFIYFILGFLSLIAFNLIWLVPSLNETKEHAALLQFEIAKRGAGEIEAFVQNKIDTIEKVSYFLNLEQEDDKHKAIMDRFLQKEQAFFEMAVVHADGKECAKVSQFEIFTEEELEDQSAQEYFKKAMKGENYTSHVYFSDKAEPFLVLSTPLYSSQKSVNGALVVKLKLREMWQVISGLKVGEDSHAFVVDDVGRLIADPNASLVLKNIILTELPPVKKLIEEGKASSGLDPEDRYKNDKGEWLLAVAAPLSKLNWGVVIERTEEDAFSNLGSKVAAFIMISLVGGVSIFLVARLISIYLVRPLKKLGEGAKIIGAGNLDYRLDLKTGDEIESLADAFNDMAGRLKESYFYLEQKVAERTKELRAQRDQLDQVAKKLIQRDIVLSQAREEQEKALVEATEAKQKAEEARVATLNILEDIEEARKAQEREKNKVEAVLLSLTDGLLVLDQFGWVSLMNNEAEKMFNVRSDKVISKRLGEIRHEEIKKLSTLLESEEGQIDKKEMTITDGEEKIIEASTAPVVDVDKKILGQLVILHDITREKAIERMKSEFVTIAAHQLRTPLSAIKWTLRLVLDQDVGPISKEQAETLEKGYQSNERMINLVNDLLNVARIEEGRFIYGFEKVSFSEFVTETIGGLQALAEMKGMTINFERPGDEKIYIMMDREKMKLALQNLIENAINYSSTSSSVTISLKRDKINVTFAVSDQGMGIPKAQQGRVFSKFFRGLNALRQETEGTGLGLFLVKNIVEKHNGSVWFESEENKGTTFYLVLPLAQEQAGDAKEPALAAANFAK